MERNSVLPEGLSEDSLTPTREAARQGVQEGEERIAELLKEAESKLHPLYDPEFTGVRFTI